MDAEKAGYRVCSSGYACSRSLKTGAGAKLERWELYSVFILVHISNSVPLSFIWEEQDNIKKPTPPLLPCI